MVISMFLTWSVGLYGETFQITMHHFKSVCNIDCIFTEEKKVIEMDIATAAR